jgi:hypothetical protein
MLRKRVDLFGQYYIVVSSPPTLMWMPRWLRHGIDRTIWLNLWNDHRYFPFILSSEFEMLSLGYSCEKLTAKGRIYFIRLADNSCIWGGMILSAMPRQLRRSDVRTKSEQLAEVLRKRWPNLSGISTSPFWSIILIYLVFISHVI